MKIIITILSTMVVLKDIYASGDNMIITLKAEEINTPLCSRGFNGTLQCYTTGLSYQPYKHCKVTCASKDWTYFYLYNKAWYNNIHVNIYFSPMTPTSTITNNIKCFTGYNTTITDCISSSDYLTYISLVCKLNCTSNYNHYIAQSDNIFNYENGSKIYQKDHFISNYETFQPM